MVHNHAAKVLSENSVDIPNVPKKVATVVLTSKFLFVKHGPVNLVTILQILFPLAALLDWVYKHSVTNIRSLLLYIYA